MTFIAIAKRYADGFLDFAGESIGFEKALGELISLKALLRDNPEFMDFLRSPEITLSEKYDVIKKTLAAAFSAEMLFFIQLLLKKNRFDNFIDIAEYARVKYAHGEEVDALVVASYPLDTSQIEAVKNSLESKFNKKVHMYMDLDTSLLGGIRATVGHNIIDGSVKKRLEELETKLFAARLN